MTNGDNVSADGTMGQVSASPTRIVRVLIDRKATRQVITGFGGNFAVARFGDRDAHDSVGGHVLANMPIGHARIGIPLKTFIKESGDNYDAAHTAVKDVFRLMETLRDRKIPVVASVWDVPDFCLSEPVAGTEGRRIAPDKRDKVIAAIGEWLRLGRQNHGLTVPYVSFHAPDGGGSLFLTPEDARYFITRGGAAFEKLALPTKWILGDTATGASLAGYVSAILSDKSVVPYIGPVSFHAWDSLSASDDAYRAIAKAARLYRKPVWCLEAGYDRTPPGESDPPFWETWEHTLNLAHSYARCLTLAEASVMDYWQFQNDHPILGEEESELADDDLTPLVRLFPAFHLLKLFAETFPADTQMIAATVIGEGILAVMGLEPQAGKLRVLLVNPGEVVDVDVSGGQPNGTYRVGGLTSAQADRIPFAPHAPESEAAAMETDKKGNVIVSMVPRSVAVLSEQ